MSQFLHKWCIGLKWIKNIPKEDHYNKTELCFFFKNTLGFSISNLGFCPELGLLNPETEIGTGVA